MFSCPESKNEWKVAVATWIGWNQDLVWISLNFVYCTGTARSVQNSQKYFGLGFSSFLLFGGSFDIPLLRILCLRLTVFLKLPFEGALFSPAATAGGDSTGLSLVSNMGSPSVSNMSASLSNDFMLPFLTTSSSFECTFSMALLWASVPNVRRNSARCFLLILERIDFAMMPLL